MHVVILYLASCARGRMRRRVHTSAKIFIMWVGFLLERAERARFARAVVPVLSPHPPIVSVWLRCTQSSMHVV